MFKKLSVVLLIFSTQFTAAKNANQSKKSFTLPSYVTESDYEKNTINIRVNAHYRNVCDNDNINHQQLQQIFSGLVITKLEKVFPNHKALTEQEINANYIDLSLIYRLHYQVNTPIEIVCNNLMTSGILIYAEPNYIYQTSAYTPNDPKAGTGAGAPNQFNFLNRIQAFNAWDLALGGSQGDTNVIIGIIDSGTDLDHPDLAANFKKNYADPVNGIDDDNDGYIDNFNGWDLGGADYNNVVGDNNGNCMGANNNHGSHVSGCASEVTDNGIGGAGIGFNCKLISVKCAADNDTRGPGGVGYIISGYEGIVYAADHGCQIINCSWGGPGGGSFGQNIIDYALTNKNALVVAAAGNSNNNLEFFPASFKNVFSVAATNNSSDTRASFSNFNYSVDISCPGNQIYATLYNDSYAASSGTSMASPMVAGICGLVKSKFPSLTAEQLREQVRVAADPHYTGTNAGFKGQLGKGRANAFKALTQNTPSIRITNYVLTDGNDNSLVAGDTVQITCDLKNYLTPTTAAFTATVYAGGASATNAYFTIIPSDSQQVIGIVNTLSTVSNSNKFKFIINSNVIQNAKIVLRFAFRDANGYVDEQYIPIAINEDYLNVSVNEISTSVTSKGRLYYNSDAQVDGLGFVFNGNSLAYEGGFMVGAQNGVSKLVSDNVRSAGATPDDDWLNSATISKITTGAISDFDAVNYFNDVSAPSPVGITSHLKFYAYNTPGNTRYVIHEYNIKNRITSTLNNVYAGIFTDWDIQNFSNNKGAEDAGLKMTYCYNTDSAGLYAGVKLLSSAPHNAHAIDNITGGTPLNFSDGVTDSEKYDAMSTPNPNAGLTGAGNDIINVLGTGPFTLAPNDSVTVAFAIIAGTDLVDLQASATAAQIKYNVLTGLKNKALNYSAELQIYPNPANTSFVINFNINKDENIVIELYDIQGKLITTLYNEILNGNKISIPVTDLSNGTYLIKIQTKNSLNVEKIVIKH